MADSNDNSEAWVSVPIDASYMQKATDEQKRNALNTFLEKDADGLKFSIIDERMKCLIALGADVNARNSWGDLPMSRIFTRYLLASPAPRILLEYGADVNAIDRFGTALHMACAYHQYEFVHLLLENGADVNVTCGENITPVDCALQGPHLRDIKDFEHCPDLLNGVPNCLLPPDEDTEDNCRDELLLLLRHLVKMRAADMYLSEANMDYFREEPEPYFNLDECEELYEVLEELPPKCDAEIALAKQTKIGTSDVSYYDIVAADQQELVRLSKIDTLLEGLRSDYEQRFPIYADMIGWNYKRAERIKRARKVGHDFLRSVLVDLPDLCVYEIISYLTERDLLLLLSAELTATPVQGPA